MKLQWYFKSPYEKYQEKGRSRCHSKETFRRLLCLIRAVTPRTSYRLLSNLRSGLVGEAGGIGAEARSVGTARAQLDGLEPCTSSSAKEGDANGGTALPK